MASDASTIAGPTSVNWLWKRLSNLKITGFQPYGNVLQEKPWPHIGRSLRDTSSFAEVKSDILKRMGATVESARNVIWLQRPRLDDNLETYTKELMTSINRLKSTWKTPEDAAHELFDGVLHRIFHQETLLLLRDGTDESPCRKAEKLRQIWSSRDYYGRRSLLRGEYPSFGYRRPRHRDELAGGLKTGTSPTVVEGEPFSRGGKVGSGPSGHAGGGGGGGGRWL